MQSFSINILYNWQSPLVKPALVNNTQKSCKPNCHNNKADRITVKIPEDEPRCVGSCNEEVDGCPVTKVEHALQ